LREARASPNSFERWKKKCAKLWKKCASGLHAGLQVRPSSKGSEVRDTIFRLPEFVGQADRDPGWDARASLLEGCVDGVHYPTAFEGETPREVMQVEKVLDPTVGDTMHDHRFELLRYHRFRGIGEDLRRRLKEVEVDRCPVGLIGPEAKKYSAFERESLAEIGSPKPVEKTLQEVALKNDLEIFAFGSGVVKQPLMHRLSDARIDGESHRTDSR
jgi:hypothetical protein